MAARNRYLASGGFLVLLLVPALEALAQDCTGPASTDGVMFLEERHARCLLDPGWFDVGAGVAVVRKAGSGGQQGVGNLVSLRAYPFGRWYAPLKKSTAATSAQVAEKAAAEEKAQKLADKAESESETAAKQADKADATPANKERANQAKKAADQAKEAADRATVDYTQSMQSALSGLGDVFAVSEQGGYGKFFRRFSVFYGRSVGGFDSKVINGDIDAFGLAFDRAICRGGLL